MCFAISFKNCVLDCSDWIAKLTDAMNKVLYSLVAST